jgi:dipeptidase E
MRIAEESLLRTPHVHAVIPNRVPAIAAGNRGEARLPQAGICFLLSRLRIRLSISTVLKRSVGLPPKSQIIAIGGASLFLEAGNPPLQRYILGQTRSRNPRICFIPTATGDNSVYIAQFYSTFSKLRCRPTHLPLFERTPALPHLLLSQDLIYVTGGNTKSMLAVWREWQLPKILRQAWSSGTVLAGISAGAICWFEMGVTDSWAKRLTPLPCLGWLPNACCPHYDSEKDRRPTTQTLVKRGDLPQTLALDDGAAAHFVGRKLLRVVSAREGAGAYRVRKRGTGVIETPLPITSLDDRSP